MPSEKEIGSRLLAHPVLILRFCLGNYILRPVHSLFWHMSIWVMGLRPLGNFGILYSPKLGYAVKVGYHKIQWYDNLSEASIALSYHLNEWLTGLTESSTAAETGTSQK